MNQPSTSTSHEVPLGEKTTKLIKRILRKLEVETKPEGTIVIPLHDSISRAARYTGINKRVLERFMYEGDRPIDIEIKDVDRQLIYNELTSMYLVKKCIPTITELFDASLHSLPDHTGVDDFTKLLVKMGFVFYKYPNQRVLRIMEKKSVTFQRYKYLKDIQEYRKNDIPIVYIGMISLNESKQFLKFDKTLTTEDLNFRRIFFTATETEIKHIKLVYSMSSVVLKHWLIKHMLHDLSPGSVLIFDDLEIYRETLCDIPTINSVKVDMIEWLTEHNIPCDINMTKAELLDLIETYTNVNENTYVIDNLVKSYHHKLLRIPKYVNGLSIIDPILNFLNNNSILKSINLNTINETFDCISRVQLCEYSNTIQQEELRLLEKDMEVDNVIDQLVKNLQSTETEDVYEEDDTAISTFSDSD